MADNTKVQVFFKRDGETDSITIEVCSSIFIVSDIARAILNECKDPENPLDTKICNNAINVTKIVPCRNIIEEQEQKLDFLHLVEQVNLILNHYLSNEQIKTNFLKETTKEHTCKDTCVSNSSGGKVSKNASKYAKTNKKVKIGNAMRCIYVGSRGGEYVMQNKAYIPLKKALVSTASASAKVSVSKKK